MKDTEDQHEENSMEAEMKHCPQCGKELAMHPKQKMPHCSDCGVVYFQPIKMEESDADMGRMEHDDRGDN